MRVDIDMLTPEEKMEFFNSKKFYFIPTDEYEAWSKEAFKAYLSIRKENIYHHVVGAMQHILYQKGNEPEKVIGILRDLERALIETTDGEK